MAIGAQCLFLSEPLVDLWSVIVALSGHPWADPEEGTGGPKPL